MHNYSFMYAGSEITYEVQRGFRRTIAISITDSRGVVVRAPHLIPHGHIHAFVLEKASWIYKKIQFLRLHAPTRKKLLYEVGELQPYLGKSYSLQLFVAPIKTVQIHEQEIHVSLPRVSPPLVKNALSHWYLEEASRILTARYHEALPLFKIHAVVPASLIVKRMRGKWGSCSHDNHILLNSELIKTPLACIDYVIYHELCHVRHHDHSPRFHRFMTTVMPDWRSRKKILAAYHC